MVVMTVNKKKEEIQKAAIRLRLNALVKYETYIDPQRPFEDNLLSLLQEQVLMSDEQRLKRRIRNAGFPQLKTFDTFVMSEEHLPFLNFDELRELKTCSFIEDKNDVVAVGPAGRRQNSYCPGNRL